MKTDRNKDDGQVVVLGEDDHDRKAIKILVSALRPDLRPSAFNTLRKPIALVKNVPPARLPDQTIRVSAVLRAVDKRKPIRCVLMHEDADDLEPAHEHLITKIERCYARLPWTVHAVVPAWEIEAWWFLFPQAVRAVRPSWPSLDRYRGRDLGLIRNAKEELKKALRQATAKPAAARPYSEADSVLIAQRTADLDLLSPPWFARSASWLAFLDRVERI